jgi:hypothetical protein
MAVTSTDGLLTAVMTTKVDWDTGYCASIILSNTSPNPTVTWSINVALNGSTIDQIWSAQAKSNGNDAILIPESWNSAIESKGKIAFGFCGTGSIKPKITIVTQNAPVETTGSGGAAATNNTPQTGGNVTTLSTPTTGGTASTSESTTVAQSSGGTSSTIRTETGGTSSTGGQSNIADTTTKVVIATGGSTSADVSCSGPTLTGGTKYCSSTTGTMSNGVGYSVWLSDSTTGTNCGTFYGNGAAFKAQWNMGSGGDFLARAGLSWNSDKTFDQLGTISADYAYTKTGVSNTTAFIGIYGWTVNPLVEFYIVEEWIGWNPASNATKVGSLTVDGGTYDVYTHTQTNQPSIQGTATFPQFFSIRTSTRSCGHISISEHFKQWSASGLTLGKMYEAKLLVEAMGGTGTVDFTTATVTAK